MMLQLDNRSRPAGATSVLLIEDDLQALAIFEQILRDNGFDVHTATSAETGLHQLESTSPDMIVLDLHLPALDGLACLRYIRAVPRLAHIPVAIITGDYLVDDEVVSQIETLEAELHLKPVWEDDLLRIVREKVRERAT